MARLCYNANAIMRRRFALHNAHGYLCRLAIRALLPTEIISDANSCSMKVECGEPRYFDCHLLFLRRNRGFF